MELIFNLVMNFSEVRKTHNQIHSHILTYMLGPWDLLRYFKVCSDAKERVGCTKQREVIAPIHPLKNCNPGS